MRSGTHDSKDEDSPQLIHPDRFAGLDGLRGLAAAGLAFVYHAQYMYNSDGANTAADAWFFTWLHRHGWTLVDLFFVLSGFIFAHVYVGANPVAGPAALKNFAMARVARLYPLHLLMLIAAALLFSDRPENDLGDFGVHLLMLQAFLPLGGHSFIGPSWSISVEIFCYALFAVATLIWRRHLWLFCIVACSAGLALMLSDPPLRDPTPVNAFGRGLFGFFIGQLLWHARAFGNGVGTPWLVGGAATGIWLGSNWLPPVIAMSLIAAPCLLLLAIRLRAFASPAMLWLGDRSYTIYLVHMVPLDLIREPHGGELPLTLAYVFGGHFGLIALTLVAADLLYRRVELPMRLGIMVAWKRRSRPATPDLGQAEGSA